MQIPETCTQIKEFSIPDVKFFAGEQQENSLSVLDYLFPGRS
ncbi:hypothetical protein SAMN04488505_11274 [Chitinophaga rupis]|uniref:Uncharacterized protein n=1 Tax=Chitinophaga rupis TaxID=573321 RepID=A0A1H8ISX5_9BACT|nr:hypothetical protein SAMN04488505_11274 [Chitinophaga rupis]